MIITPEKLRGMASLEDEAGRGGTACSYRNAADTIENLELDIEALADRIGDSLLLEITPKELSGSTLTDFEEVCIRAAHTITQSEERAAREKARANLLEAALGCMNRENQRLHDEEKNDDR